MSEIQELDRKSAFIFVGDLNAHLQEWLQSVSPTDHHGIAAFDFTNLSGCTQLIKEPTHNFGHCLDAWLKKQLLGASSGDEVLQLEFPSAEGACHAGQNCYNGWIHCFSLLNFLLGPSIPSVNRRVP